MVKYFSEKSLLKAPVERAAFSDRQAYVCAELSRLAYFRFEGGQAIEEILQFARPFIGESGKFKLFEAELLSRYSDDSFDRGSALVAFKQILNAAKFERVQVFSRQGTQGFFCTRTFWSEARGSKTVAYLAFRGTEPRKIADIRTDVRATLAPATVGDYEMQFHTGYLEEVRRVQTDILPMLERTPHQQLIVTGHSLGGALAIVFARLHASSVNGACYTFGAPPVGSIEVQKGFKTPVYEIINELDIVPNLPNPWLGAGAGVMLRLLRLLLKMFTVTERLLASGNWDEKLERYIDMMTRYRHPGYKSYLVGSGKHATLRYNLNSYDALSLWWRMIFNSRLGLRRFEKLVSDHMIDTYLDKIRVHSLDRNRQEES